MVNNLFSNLLVVTILLFLGTIIYLRVTNKSLTDLFREIKEIFSGGEVDE